MRERTIAGNTQKLRSSLSYRNRAMPKIVAPKVMNSFPKNNRNILMVLVAPTRRMFFNINSNARWAERQNESPFTAI